VSELPVPINHGELPTFSTLINSLFIPLYNVRKDPLDQRTLSSRKYQIVERFIREYRWRVGDDIYPVGRLALPDKDNRIYYLKESKLGDMITKIYKIPKNSVDYKKITQWKRSVENSFGRGDVGFAEICCNAIRSRVGTDNNGNIVTVDELNNFLNEFGKTTLMPQLLEAVSKDENKSTKQFYALKELFDKMSVEEIRWFIKIILKLNILKGAANMFLACWHPDAPKLLDVVSDLKRVFYELPNPKKKLGKINIRLLNPFKPQLALRTEESFTKIVERLGSYFYIEEKLDGERMQLHMDNYGETFAYFSRNATNYTQLYGSDYTKPSLTKYIKGCFNEKVKSVILDGEMVVYDHRRKTVLPFGYLKGAAKSTIDGENTARSFDDTARPMYVVYDILYLNGASFENAKLEDRREYLSRILNPIENVIEIVKYSKCHTAEEIENSIRNAIRQSKEGIIIKNPNSKYFLAERNSSWIKIKPEYLDEFGEEVDIVIIGKIRSSKTTYVCGLRDDENDQHFVSFCSIANGLSNDDYKMIEKKIGNQWKKYQKNPPSADIVEFGKKIPDEWINPKESVVIQVKARSIDIGIGGKSYKAGTTLYNAYFRSIREDKTWEDSLSIEDYKKMKNSHSRKRILDENGEHEVVTRKNAIRRKISNKSLIAQNLSEKIQVNENSKLFNNLVFYVLTDYVSCNERLSVNDLISIIKKNGGKITKNERLKLGSGKLIIISDKLTLSTKSLINEGYDIIRPNWMFNCITVNEIVRFEPTHLLKASDELYQSSLRNVDKNGDSF
ncbi:hypothetical protein PACTADRAFT_24823, partial [Pachysolen tannophilus NRRL Y-2460]